MDFETKLEVFFSGHGFQENKLLAHFLRWSIASFTVGMKNRYKVQIAIIVHRNRGVVRLHLLQTVLYRLNTVF